MLRCGFGLHGCKPALGSCLCESARVLLLHLRLGLSPLGPVCCPLLSPGCCLASLEPVMP